MIRIWTDGSCISTNEKAGGWAYLISNKGKTIENYGGMLDTTNNKAELTAAIQALQAIKKPSNITMHCDSQYVIKGMTEWRFDWEKRKWRTMAGEKVKNQQLWQVLIKAASPHNIKWIWVKGHANDANNIRVDKLATKGRINAIKNKKDTYVEPVFEHELVAVIGRTTPGLQRAVQWHSI